MVTSSKGDDLELIQLFNPMCLAITAMKSSASVMQSLLWVRDSDIYKDYENSISIEIAAQFK